MIEIKQSKYQVVYTGQGAGYDMYDIIWVSGDNVADIAKEINLNSCLNYTDLGLLNGTMDEMSFGTKVGYKTSETVVLKIRKI